MPSETELCCLSFPILFKSYFKALNLTVLWVSSCFRNFNLYCINTGNTGLLSFSIPFDRLYVLILYFKLNTFLKEKKLLFAKEIIFPVNSLCDEWHQGELEN